MIITNKFCYKKNKTTEIEPGKYNLNLIKLIFIFIH
jgi:hypothetical protein